MEQPESLKSWLWTAVLSAPQTVLHKLFFWMAHVLPSFQNRPDTSNRTVCLPEHSKGILLPAWRSWYPLAYHFHQSRNPVLKLRLLFLFRLESEQPEPVLLCTFLIHNGLSFHLLWTGILLQLLPNHLFHKVRSFSDSFRLLPLLLWNYLLPVYSGDFHRYILCWQYSNPKSHW